MALIHIKEDFLPKESRVAIMSLWGFSEEGYNTKLKDLEIDALSVIEANTNIVLLDKFTFSPLRGLCENYVHAKLLEKFNDRGYEDIVESLLTSFWDTLNSIRERQQEEGKSTDEVLEVEKPRGIVF